MRRSGRVGLVGAAVAVLAVIGLLRSPVLALGMALVLAALATVIATEAVQRTEAPLVPWLTVLRWAVGGGCTAFVLAGLVSVFGPEVIPVVLAALAGFIAWYLWRDWQRWRRRPAQHSWIDANDDLVALSNVELGQEWRTSRTRLGAARDAAELAWLCDVRQRLLEEMERRNPAGFEQWLGSGARDSVSFLRGS